MCKETRFEPLNCVLDKVGGRRLNRDPSKCDISWRQLNKGFDGKLVIKINRGRFKRRNFYEMIVILDLQ